MIRQDKINQLYNWLKEDGANVGTESEFSKWFTADGERGYNNRKQVWQAFKLDGADVGDTYEEFMSLIKSDKPVSQPQPVASKPASQQPIEASVAGLEPQVTASEVETTKAQPQATQTATPLSDDARKRMEMQMEVMKQNQAAYTANTDKIVDDAKRMMLQNPMTEQGRQQAKVGEMQRQLLGEQKPIGLSSGSGASNKPQRSEQQQPNAINNMSPTAYGITKKDGKWTTQYMLPNGELTDDLLQVDAAETAARRGRLTQEFLRRMRDNGLNPAKKEDVQKQADLDYFAPVAEAVNGAYDEIKAADDEQDKKFREDIHNSLTYFDDDNFTAELTMRAARQKANFDTNVITEKALSAIPESFRKQYTDNLARYYAQNPEECYGLSPNQAAEESLRKIVHDFAVERRLEALKPKDNAEFFFRKLVEQPLLSPAVIIDAASSSMVGNKTDSNLNQQAMQQYESAHKAVGLGVTVLGMMMDPAMYIGMPIGALVARGALNLIGRFMLKGASRPIATRYAGMTLGGRLAAGAAEGAGNFAVFEGLHEAQRQALYDSEFSPGSILGQTLHGAIMGGSVGWVGPMLGNTVSKINKTIDSTAGKAAIKGTANWAVAPVLEGTIFATPELLSEDNSDKMSVWADNVATMYGFKLGHALKGIGTGAKELGDKLNEDYRRYKDTEEYIPDFKRDDIVNNWQRNAPSTETVFEEFKKFIHTGKTSLKEHIRNRIRAEENTGINDDERRWLDEHGYKEIKDLFVQKNNNKKIVDGNIITEKPAEDGSDLTVLQDFVNDNTIPEALRAKMYYIATGKILPASTISGYRLDTNNRDGKESYSVTVLNSEGNPILTKYYKSKDLAEAYGKDIQRQVELNQITIAEQKADEKAYKAGVNKTVNDIAARYGVSADDVVNSINAITSKYGDKAADVVSGLYNVPKEDMLERIGEYISRRHGLTEYERNILLDFINEVKNENPGVLVGRDIAMLNEFQAGIQGSVYRQNAGSIRAELSREWGMNVDDAIRKRYNERNKDEQELVQEYLNRLNGGKRKPIHYGEKVNEPDPIGFDNGTTEEIPVGGNMRRGTSPREDNKQPIIDDKKPVINENNPVVEENQPIVEPIDPIDPIELELEAARKKVNDIAHDEKGDIQPVLIADGRDEQPHEAYVLQNTVVPDASGNVDRTKSDEMVVVYDNKEGKKKIIPTAIIDKVHPTSTVDETMAVQEQIIKQSYHQPQPQQFQQPNNQPIANNNEQPIQPPTQQMETTAGQPVEQQQEQPMATNPIQPIEQPIVDNTIRPTMQATEQQPIAQLSEHQPESALARVPVDANDTPVFTDVEPETAYDAIAEMMDGNEEDRDDIIKQSISNISKQIDSAKKKVSGVKLQGNNYGKFKAEKAAARQQLESLQQQLEKWNAIAGVGQQRAELAAAEVKRQEEERKAAEDAARQQAVLEAEQRAAAARLKAQQVGGVPEMSLDKPQDARARGFRNVNGEKVYRQEPLQAKQGKEVSVMFSTNPGDTPKGRVAVIEAGHLQPSHIDKQRNPLHFIDEAQPKERTDKASMQGAMQIASGIRPEVITATGTAYTGTPTVNTRGEVIQGNNRSAALKMMYDEYQQQAQKYKQYLIDHAEEYGLTKEDIMAMEQPVLVTMLDVNDNEAIRLGQFVAQDTESGGQERIKADNTIKKLGDKTRSFFNVLLKSTDDEMSIAQLIDANGITALKWLRDNKIITDTQYTSALDSKGNLNGEAKNDLRNILYKAIFEGGSTRLEEMFNNLPAKAQKAILATAYRDFDSPATERIIPELQNAIEAFTLMLTDKRFAAAKNSNEARRAMNVWAAQTTFGPNGEVFVPSRKYSNFALELAVRFKGDSQNALQGLFNELYDLIQGTKEDNLFETSDKTPKTLAQAIKQTLNIDYNGQDERNALVGNNQESEERRQGTDATPAGGEQAPQGEGASDGGGRTDADGTGRGVGERIASAEADANAEPTDKQKEAGDLSDDEAETLLSRMKANAVTAPSIMITEDNWAETFDTPIGVVKMGENQKTKLLEKGRADQYGMLVETLSKPDIILEENDREPNLLHERASSYLFVKTFRKEDGSKYIHFESVTVSQDGMEVSISSHMIRENQLKNKMKSDRLLYKATALDESANPSAEQPIKRGGSLSSEGKGSEKGGEKQEGKEERLKNAVEKLHDKAVAIPGYTVFEYRPGYYTDGSGALVYGSKISYTAMPIDDIKPETIAEEIRFSILTPKKRRSDEAMSQIKTTSDYAKYLVEYEGNTQADANMIAMRAGKELQTAIKIAKDGLAYDRFLREAFIPLFEEAIGKEELMKNPIVKKYYDGGFDADAQRKEAQLEIINRSNPAPDDYHTWVRSTDDILTLQEAVDDVISDDSSYNLSSYPDVSDNTIREALRTGRIRIYSSYPIKNGVFVTPSKMQAMDYAGDGKVYSKEVPISDIAWINTDEGQYAAISENNNDIDSDGGAMFRDGENYSQEERGIIDKAKADGTYMKAPNGKPTKLTEKQWAQVRTKAFKEWFGDWEKAARIDKLRKSESVSITGNEIDVTNDFKQNKKNALEYGKKLQGEYVNADTGMRIQLQRGRKNGGIKEVLQHNYKDIPHIQSVAAIPQIIEKSVYIESEKNNDLEKNPSVVEYQHFVCGLKIGDEDYTVYSTMAVDKDGNRYYDHNLTHIEKTKLLDSIDHQAVIGQGFDTTSGTEPTTFNGYKGKKLLELLQTKVSKDLDENGEPKFDADNGDIKFHFIGEKGAANADKVEDKTVKYSAKQKGLFGDAKQNPVQLSMFDTREDDGEQTSEAEQMANDAIEAFAEVYNRYADEEDDIITGDSENPNNSVEAELIQAQNDLNAALTDFYKQSGNSEEDAARMAKDMLVQVRSEVEVSRIFLRNAKERASQRLQQEEWTKEEQQLQQQLQDAEKQQKNTCETAGGEAISVESGGGLPKLKRGEFAVVERQFAIDKNFTFDGKAKIESIDDVAYIFRQLESYCVEHAFAMLVKDGKPTIVHLGMGTFSATQVNTGALRAAVDKFGADSIYFIHNHPSGALKPSFQDQNLFNELQSMFKGKKVSVDAIIIDTTSGKYVQFSSGTTLEGNMPKNIDGAIEYPVHSFSKQVFNDVEVPQNVIRSSSDVAEVLSTLRLGKRNKLGFLLLNRAHQVVGNIFSNYGSYNKAKDIADEIVKYALHYGADSVVTYGNVGLDGVDKVKSEVSRLSGRSVTLLDGINVSNGLSAVDTGVMESGVPYEKEDGAKFRDRDVREMIAGLFMQAVSGRLKGKPVSIGRLTQAGKEYLEHMSGLKFKDYVDFVLNPSDLVHIYKRHFGDNEKDGRNIPLEIEDIKNLSEVISQPDRIIYSKEDKGLERNMFSFLKGAERGTYNLLEIYSDKRGNLTAKSFYKSKEGVSQRAILLERTLHSTSETDGATLNDDAKIPQMFELSSVEEDKNADKEKALRFIEALPTHPGTTITSAELDNATKIVKGFENPSVEGDKKTEEAQMDADDDIRYRTVDAESELGKRLEAIPHDELVETYRNVQLFADDSMGSPMAYIDKETGEIRIIEGGKWDDSNPQKIRLTDEQIQKLGELNENGYVMIEGKKSSVLPINKSLRFEKPKNGPAKLKYWLVKNENGDGMWADYNPYNHSIETPLNTQFSTAYKRPNLVVVKCLVPKSELENGFQADYANLPTGAHQWNNGRTLYLSRYSKIVGVLSRKEEARLIDEYWKKNPKKYTEGKKNTNYECFVPQVRRELEKLGYKFQYKGRWLTPEEALALDEKFNPTDVPFITDEDIARVDAKISGKWTAEPLQEANGEDIEAVNERFNEELQQQIDGTLPKGHIYQLGKPGELLKACGFPDMPIELSSTNLLDHSKKERHRFEIGDIKGLVKELQNPIAVFTYGDKSKSQNVIVEIQRDGKNFLVGVHFNQVKNGTEVSSIRGIFPKDNSEWLNWIAKGLSVYLNKGKIQTLIDQQRMTLADVEYLDLDSVAKIVKEFENPSVEGDKKTEEARMAARAQEIADGLNTPVRIVQSEEEISQLPTYRKRHAKGWFDTATGEVVVVVPNNENMADVENTVAHEIVAHKGLRKLVGDERFDGFLDDVYSNLDSKIKEIIDERVRDEIDRRAKKMAEQKGNGILALAEGYDEANRQREAITREIMEEYMAELAGKIGEHGFEKLEKEEKSLWAKIKERVMKFLDAIMKGINIKGFKLTDKDLAYILYRSWKNLRDKGSLFDIADDITMRYKTGFNERREKFRDGNTPDDNNRRRPREKKSPKEIAEEKIRNIIDTRIATIKESLIDANDEAFNEKMDRIEALGGNIGDLIKAMSAQRRYDYFTVDTVVGLAQKMLESKALDNVSSYEVKRLLVVARSIVGKTDTTKDIRKLLNIIIDNQLRNLDKMLNGFINTKGTKLSDKGVEVLGELDPETAIIVKTIKKYKDYPVEAYDANGELLPETIIYVKNEIVDKMASDDKAIAENAALTHQGLVVARLYSDLINSSKDDERQIRKEIEDTREERKVLKQKKKAIKAAPVLDDTALRDCEEKIKTCNDAISSYEDTLIIVKNERISSLVEVLKEVSDIVDGGFNKANEWRMRDRERISDIHHDANSDLFGKPEYEHYTADKELTSKITNNFAVRFFLQPLATFDMMMRMLGGNNARGEGYLWNRFMRQWVDATGNEYDGYRECLRIIEDKLGEIFGRKMSYSDLIKYTARQKPGYVRFYDAGEMRGYKIDHGGLLYMYMADKMFDGRMKLRKMGISEDDMEVVSGNLDPKLKEFADWVQEEFLVSRRNKYNEIHKRIFGAPMAAIENYFPLRILQNARVQKVDVAQEQNEGVMPTTITGGIIKRKRNGLPLDVLNTNAVSVLLDHIQEMERWSAFAEFNRDLNTLLSYKRFKNKVLNMNSVYGSGKRLWRNLRDVCAIAGGSYRPPVATADKIAVNLAKGVSTAKVSGRIFTAFKQLASMPAFVADANMLYLAKSIANPKNAWEWSMKELPLFRKRWESRMSGDPRLQKSDLDWSLWRSDSVQTAQRIGMTPNAFVDAVTVAIGSYAIYKTKKRKYQRYGFPEEVAEKRAKQDAMILPNETQQSSESAFLSTIQVDKSWISVLFSVFRNSSMSYTRKLFEGVRNLRNIASKNGNMIEFMQKQYERWGAENPNVAARSEFNSGIVSIIVMVALFGYIMQFFWNCQSELPYLIFGDDDEEKKKAIDRVVAQSLFGGIEGFTAGDVLSSAGTKLLDSGKVNWRDLLKAMPVTNDVENLFSKLGNNNIVALNDLINIAVQSGVGINPQTITDMVVAFIDASNGDLDLSREAMMCFLRVINCPQSQLEKIYIDELQMSGEKAAKLTPKQFAERYAKYKVMRNAPLTGWLYTDEQRDKMVAYKGKKIFTQSKESFNDFTTSEAKGLKPYLEEYERTKEYLRKLSKLKKEDEDLYYEKLDEYSNTPAYEQYEVIKYYNTDINELTNIFLSTRDKAEMDSCVNAMVLLKRELLQSLESIDK